MQEIVLSNNYVVPSKAEIALQVQNIADLVSNGEIDPLRAYGLLTALEKVAGDAKKAIAEKAISEKEKYGNEKQTSVYGATFEIAEAGVKYDYSVNPAWRELQEQIDILRAEQKGLEKSMVMLKAAPKTSTTIIKCTLNK